LFGQAVPYALLKYNSQLKIDAVDRAKIRPDLTAQQLESLASVHFYAEQDIVDLSAQIFVNDSYDAMVSQFGAEYASLTKVLERCLPLVKKGGMIKFIVHHEGSDLLKSSRRKLEELFDVLNDGGFVDTLVNWANGIATFDDLEQQGVVNIERCKVRSEQISGQIFGAVRAIAELAEANPKGCIEIAENLKVRMLAERQRLEQLSDAAHDQQEIQALMPIFIEHGFAPAQYNEIKLPASNYLLAWNIESLRLA